ncbi:FapA family protein [Gracilibacillus sp. S3-1-1]|uniref:FapA family protein n=1 Tax=Gracilibacillus pellucidus TaxID=3095368 RepID=A0ACC6M7L1_9BACI|nr:FapA family protein [Gracilibacillus sp. S3-1-1]MDX8046963.1 FapA family protein [Gracilibacillus sp. S3-1-1]
MSEQKEIKEIKKKIDIHIEKSRLTASIYLKDVDGLEEITEEDVIRLLDSYEVSFGITSFASFDWKQKLKETSNFVIAKGAEAENGLNGKLILKQSTDQTLSDKEKTNFRDVVKIPMVEEGDILAQLIPPTDGKAGRDVFNRPLKAKKGKKLTCKSGEGVLFNEEDKTFIAATSGQLSVGERVISVFPLYEITGDLSLETGNVKFNGSVWIKGSVPSGYQVDAKGDVTIQGIVESAQVNAGGNIVINEGIAGMDNANVTAKGSIEVGYINQADVTAGQDLIVKKSIMHSNCFAQQSIYCTNGSIIGGSCSAGKVIEVKNVGNPANTKTELAFGIQKSIMDRVNELKVKQKELSENEQKLRNLGYQLQQRKESSGGLSSKERITLLKQRNMFSKTREALLQVEEELNELQFEIGNFSGLELIVKGRSYENVELLFGKYKRKLNQEHHYFRAYLDEKEVTIQTLSQ